MKRLLNLKMLFQLTLTVAILLIAISSVKSGENDKIIIGEQFTIKSELLDQERTMLVCLPVGYEITDQHYPVLYILDGKTHFIHTSGILEFLSRQGNIPQTILVAITNVDRKRDFTPTKIKKNASTGGADKFMSFIEYELKPYINKNYRTEPYETIVGHSLGGLFVTYSFLKSPDMFDAYFAISPYFMYDNNMLINIAADNIKKNYRNQKFFYMTLGDEPAYTETVETFVKIIEKASPAGVYFQYTHMINEDHGSIPHLSIYQGLEANYPDWQVSKDQMKAGLASIDNHYKTLSKKYGYKLKTPEYIINILGYSYLGNKEISEAINVFAENAKRFPNSANVYDSLGEAYENNNQLSEARENYRKAIKIAEKEKHLFLMTYRENLKRVNEMPVGK